MRTDQSQRFDLIFNLFCFDPVFIRAEIRVIRVPLLSAFTTRG
jgi:hypothetical protein